MLCAGDPVPQQAVIENTSDKEDEVDFGFWEKAPDPASKKNTVIATASDKLDQQQRQTENLQEADLDLL